MKRSAWRYLWTAPDIRRKLLYTLGLLVIYRLAAHVPVPGVNREVIQNLLSGGGAAGAFLNLLDLLSGGTVANFSVLAMGVYPYITAQIILQILVPIIPSWKERMEEDPREGQKWMERWTYILSVPLAALQAIGQINLFSALVPGQQVLRNFGFSGSALLPSLAVILSMTAGTMFAIWLGELISEYGLRNQGLSLIIFAGIVARMPSNFARLLSDQQNRWFYLFISLVVLVLTVFLIVYVQQGRRNIPVMYPGRRVGMRMSMPVKGQLPLMVNMAGMIPLIFAQSLLALPGVVAGFLLNAKADWLANAAAGMQHAFSPTSGWYWLGYFLMVVLFTFFYTDVVFMQQSYGEQLRRAGAKIPGVPPGEPTQRYLTKVLRRITLPGALFLGLVAVLPYLLSLLFPSIAGAGSSGLLLISSAGLLIVVGVVRDIFFFIDAELRLHGYQESLLVR
ncbi:MAG TPA: preprotein translocase subunit SecY [Anaerolineae bacterium]|nr:preprotein translocase subunit SecY [Anaerolineae bacterium]HID84691.1 preprotein translocase subunit SecY [Anaerolineales bacterium]HIQ09448.1 preprotein translocase subunit SecY [Anaerolineaceae bacterium]